MTAVILAIRENGSKMAYFSHSAGTAHGAPPMITMFSGMASK